MFYAMNYHYIGPRPKYDGFGQSTTWIQELLHEQGCLAIDDSDVAFIYGKPLEIFKVKSRYKVLMVMFESTRMPDEWFPALRLADVVLTPSTFCTNIIRAQFGIQAMTIPLGYDDRYFVPRERTESPIFTFLHYEGFSRRKGFFELMKAWRMAFTDENVRLVVKTTRETLPLAGYRNYELIEGNMTKEQLSDLHADSDCFVFPSMGEGFGHPPLEALASGSHVIAPNQHGIAEYFDPHYMSDVQTRDIPARYDKYRGRDMGRYQVCDVDDLARQLKEVYNRRNELAKFRKERQEYALNYTGTLFAQQIADILKGFHGTYHNTLSP